MTDQPNKLIVKAACLDRDVPLPFTIEFVEWNEEEIDDTETSELFQEAYVQAESLAETLLGLLPHATTQLFMSAMRRRMRSDSKEN